MNKIEKIFNLFTGKKGLEIGGPSSIFGNNGAFPLYSVIEELDCCNFSENTLWEMGLVPGRTYKWKEEKTGNQIIWDITNLSEKIPLKFFDFVISSNSLEHVANPLKAINECLKVIKDKGLLLIIVPKKESNFDHKRPITPFRHLLQDYNNNIGEDDLTHLNEILMLHDLVMDPPAGNIEQFKERSLQNYFNRALHQHVFDIFLLIKIYEFFQLEILFTGETDTDYAIVGRKI